MAGLMASRKIEALGEGVHRIERGLYVRKRAGRKAVWLFIYSLAGKRREIVLGTTEALGITAARAQMQKAREQVAQGLDPVAERKAAQKALTEAAEKPFTFADLCAEALPVIQARGQWRGQWTAPMWERLPRQYAFPVIGAKTVTEITREDVLEILRPIWTAKTKTASYLRMQLEAFFSYAVIKGMRQDNPALWRGGLSFFLPPASKARKPKHHESLTVEEARQMLSLTNWNRPPIGWAAVAFCILTASRANEAAGARWTEIDLEAKTWAHLRRKDGKDYPHRVPLSTQAIKLLSLLERQSEYVFPGNLGRKYLHEQTLRCLLVARMKKGTMHGMRSTFRDWAAEAGIDRVLAEKALMHATGGAVEQAYQRSDLLEQRRPVMQAWADAVMPLEMLG